MLRIFLTSFVALLLIVVYVPAKRNIAGYAQVIEDCSFYSKGI